MYFCPAERNHRKAKYLGVYSQKRVQAVGRIAKVVPCTVHLEARKVDALFGAGGLSQEEEQRILGATERASTLGWEISKGHKFYICDAMEETNFQKVSPGGMWRPRYFDLKDVLADKIPSDLHALADRLRNLTWE